MPSLNTGNAILSNAIAVNSSYNVGIGGAASGSFKLQVTGTTNLTGALTGTSAALTSTLSAMATNIQFNLDGTFGANYYTMGFGGVSNGFNRIAGGTGTTDGLYILAATGRDIVFRTNGSGSNVLVLASTGAATFSSSVTAGGNVTINSSSLLRLGNSDNASTMQIWNSQSGAANNFLIYDNAASAYRFVISNTGNVGIGTSSPTNKLTTIGSETGTQITTIPIGKFVNTGNAFSKLIVGSDNANYDAVISMDNNATLANCKLRFYIGNGTTSTAGHSNDQLVIQGNGNVGIDNSSPSGKFEIGSAGYANASVYGGHLFNEIRIPQATWTTFANVTDNTWNGITELTWTSLADYNRSGAAYMRWAYEAGAAALGVVYTLFNNSQNATATFRNSGGALQIFISGGAADYYVQVRVQGSRAA